jgi:hypothetical protein
MKSSRGCPEPSGDAGTGERPKRSRRHAVITGHRQGRKGRSGSPPPGSSSLYLLESLPSGIIVHVLDYLRPSTEDVLRLARASGSLHSKLVKEWGGWICQSEHCEAFTFCSGEVEAGSLQAPPQGGLSGTERLPCTSRYAPSLCRSCDAQRTCNSCTPRCSVCHRTPCPGGYVGPVHCGQRCQRVNRIRTYRISSDHG